MNKNERVVENLNRAHHALLASDPHVFVLGEDLLDPYGGAFKVSKGLSSRFPERILTTPLSEETFLGIAGGLALAREKVVVEIMFGDFIALGYDQILNFASKAVSMYGRPLPLHMVVRCPVGGGRAYGPTHSQSMQKYFIGIPGLHLFEMSPFHDNVVLLDKLVNLGQPCILFEDKVLYTQRMYTEGLIDDYFMFETLDIEQNFVKVALNVDRADRPDGIIIAAGGMVARCLQAMKKLFLNCEMTTQLLIPSKLYPFHLQTIVPYLLKAEWLFVAEESVPGGTWGGQVTQQIYEQLWSDLKHPIHCIHSKESIIPSSAHLEKQVIVQSEDIYEKIREVAYATN